MYTLLITIMFVVLFRRLDDDPMDHPSPPRKSVAAHLHECY